MVVSLLLMSWHSPAGCQVQTVATEALASDGAGNSLLIAAQGLWGFVLAESGMNCAISSSLWVVLQIMEVEPAQLFASKENQEFPESLTYVSLSVQLGVQPNKEFAGMLC